MNSFFPKKKESNSEDSIIKNESQETAKRTWLKTSSREQNKTLASIRNVFLAFLIGAIPFILVWGLMSYFDFDCPERFKYFLSHEEWQFWSRLLASLLLTGIGLKLADSVSEEKNKFTNGISKALLLTLIMFIFWHYGISKPSREPQKKAETSLTKVKESENPFSYKIPSYILVLDAGKESKWMPYRVGYSLDTWGDKSRWDIIYEDGYLYRVDGKNRSSSYDPRGNTRFKVRSLVDNQEIYVYLTRTR